MVFSAICEDICERREAALRKISRYISGYLSGAREIKNSRYIRDIFLLLAGRRIRRSLSLLPTQDTRLRNARPGPGLPRVTCVRVNLFSHHLHSIRCVADFTQHRGHRRHATKTLLNKRVTNNSQAEPIQSLSPLRTHNPTPYPYLP